MAKRIFISYHHEDEAHYRRLVNLLNDRKYFVHENYSIDPSEVGRANSPRYIAQKIRTRINDSDTVLVLVGKETHSRPWVDWEIEYAHRQGKRIAGVWVRGGKDSDLPSNFNKYGDTLVGWDTEKIVEGIRGGTEWVDSHGKRRKNHEGSGITCKS